MYGRYFSPGQKVLIQTLRSDELPARREALNVLFSNYELGHFDVLIPQGWPAGERTPFCEGQPLEIISECYGIWLKSTASLHSQPSDKVLRLQVNNDLCLFRHNPQQRVDTRIGLRYSTQRFNLPAFFRQWRQQISKLARTDAALIAPAMSTDTVNLSASGIRLPVQSSLNKQDICLLMMTLGQPSSPICTLCETIWTAPAENGQGQIAGLQFLNILEQDQQRLATFVRQNLAARRSKNSVAAQ